MSNEIIDGQFFVIYAPSGAGKTSLVNALVEEMADLTVSVSHTTRSMRPGEVNGINYHFVTVEEFAKLKNDGAFVESAEVFGHQYGTAKSSLQESVRDQKAIILEIDWQGAKQVKDLFPWSTSIFILPPSRSALISRLETRGQDDSKIIRNRMKEARTEISHCKDADFIVLNDQFERALYDLKAIVRASKLAARTQRIIHKRLITTLLEETE